MDIIREAWAGDAASAEVIMAIGARPVLDDHHIWNTVISSSARPGAALDVLVASRSGGVLFDRPWYDL